MSVYSFRSGPTYRAASPDEQFTAAFDMPLSVSSTLGEQFKGGILESLGLGTTIREVQLPDEAPTSPMATMAGPDGETITVPDTPQMRRRATVQGFNLQQETPEQFAQRRRDAGALDENQYKASPYFREGVKWDMGMTADRAAALAEAYDAKRVREYFASKRPFTAFIGNLAGQAVDPINYIPIAGPAVKAASVAKFGRVAGSAAVGALDAAANTALASGATYNARKSMGDEITWQSTVTDIALGALIGSAFGTISGVVDARRSARIDAARQEAQQRLATLKNVQDARIALNGAIDGLARGEDVVLPANAAEAVHRVQGKALEPASAVQPTGEMIEPPVPEGMVRVYHSGAAGEGQTGRWVSTSREYASNYRADLPLFYLDLPKTDPRINNADIPEQGVDQGFTFNFETKPDEAAQLRQISRDKDAGAAVVDSIEIAGKKVDIFGADTPANTAQSFPRAGGERVLFPVDGKLTEGTVFQNVSGGHTLVRTDDGKLYRSTWEAMADASSPRQSPVIGTAPIDQPPTGKAEAEARIAKPATPKETAEQFRVNPEDGSFIEQADIEQIRKEGRLTADDDAALAEAQQTFDNGLAYGEALKAVAGCFI